MLKAERKLTAYCPTEYTMFRPNVAKNAKYFYAFRFAVDFPKESLRGLRLQSSVRGDLGGRC